MPPVNWELDVVRRPGGLNVHAVFVVTGFLNQKRSVMMGIRLPNCVPMERVAVLFVMQTVVKYLGPRLAAATEKSRPKKNVMMATPLLSLAPTVIEPVRSAVQNALS